MEYFWQAPEMQSPSLLLVVLRSLELQFRRRAIIILVGAGLPRTKDLVQAHQHTFLIHNPFVIHSRIYGIANASDLKSTQMSATL